MVALTPNLLTDYINKCNINLNFQKDEKNFLWNARSRISTLSIV